MAKKSKNMVIEKKKEAENKKIKGKNIGSKRTEEEKRNS